MSFQNYEMARIYKIHGLVQGVGFRSFVYYKAQSLGIHGYVQNETDGTVTVFAEGNKDTLSTFEKYLRAGSDFSHVTEVEIFDALPSGYNDFEIR